MLKELFIALHGRHTSAGSSAADHWEEIRQHHTEPHRHYHTLAHLEHLYGHLLEIKERIEDWDTLLFTLFYHDVIYDPKAKDNEEQSALLAQKRLSAIAYPAEKTQRCVQQILATKSHSLHPDPDANYFTDADLSILAAPWEHYAAYMQAVRQEYRMYPDLLYKPGRRSVLKHFLQMERIYKTDFFFERFEQPARTNLEKELSLL